MRRFLLFLVVFVCVSPFAFAQAYPDITRLVKQVEPSVVNISTAKEVTTAQRGVPLPEEFFRRFFGDDFPFQFPQQPQQGEPQTRRSTSLGSGFVVSSDGYIVTNNHVIEGADEITVTMNDEREFKAKLIGRDKALDLALLKIEVAGLTPLRLGDSDAVDVGQWVFAVGNPFGLSGTVTVGVISAKDREIGQSPYDSFLQTDASINPGNSGGPLLNLNGEVIGINTAIVASGQGLGFAIPINILSSSLTQLKEKGKISRGWLGVALQKLTPELAQSSGLPKDAKGVLVTSVEPGQPAEKGGVRAGDVIVTFNGQEIGKYHDIFKMVARTAPGATVNMEVMRAGGRKLLRVTLGERPDEQTADGAAPAPKAPEEPGVFREHGIAFAMENSVLVIRSVEEKSAAFGAGVRIGMQVLEVNDQPVNDFGTLKRALRRTSTGFVKLLVRHQGANRFIAFKLES